MHKKHKFISFLIKMIFIVIKLMVSKHTHMQVLRAERTDARKWAASSRSLILMQMSSISVEIDEN